MSTKNPDLIRYRYKNRYIITVSPNGMSYRFRNQDRWDAADYDKNENYFPYEDTVIKSRLILEQLREQVRTEAYRIKKGVISLMGTSILISPNSPDISEEELDNFFNERDEWHKIEELEKDPTKMYD